MYCIGYCVSYWEAMTSCNEYNGIFQKTDDGDSGNDEPSELWFERRQSHNRAVVPPVQDGNPPAGDGQAPQPPSPGPTSASPSLAKRIEMLSTPHLEGDSVSPGLVATLPPEGGHKYTWCIPLQHLSLCVFSASVKIAYSDRHFSRPRLKGPTSSSTLNEAIHNIIYLCTLEWPLRTATDSAYKLEQVTCSSEVLFFSFFLLYGFTRTFSFDVNIFVFNFWYYLSIIRSNSAYLSTFF